MTGQEGVLVSLEYYYNSIPPHKGSGNEGLGNTDIGAAHADCTGLASPNCRLGLQLENRTDEWLVFKNGHASLVVNRLSLDASRLSEASSASAMTARNWNKFRNEDGDCLLGSGNCTDAYLNDMPAVKAHYPGTGAGGYDPVTGVSSGYSDVRFGMYFEGLAVESNTALNVQDGFMQNANGSFMGGNIADNNGHQAMINFGGNFYMYGF
ncbi:hypothetical protein MU846_01595 [Alcanivorax sp. CY1518]|uniref:Uncharacterized protein n=1 Tax=Alcanivorax quisquiliarum TaxID=2933565 RepID=A0ABT0E3K0_9GAMM|nr:hypothetical protein [Alcanivorax quisquiliarum]